MYLKNKTILLLTALWFLIINFRRQIAGDVVSVIELTSDWRLKNQNESFSEKGLKLPVGVYSALYKEEVLQGKNDVNLRWIAYDNWTFSKRFAFNGSDSKDVRCVNLTLYGIDTVAEIRLNHDIIGYTDNMFVRYSYDVYDRLRDDNLLEIEIMSPVRAAKTKADKLLANFNVTVPPTCPPARYNGECHMNMLRKMQASFAWDWGLAAPSMGIWKTVALEYFEVAVIRDIDIAITKNSTHWNMAVRVFMDSGLQRDFYADLIFYAVELLEKPINISHHRSSPINYKAPIIEFEQALPIENVIEWWPNGYGNQKLYPLHFTLNAWLDSTGPSLRAKSISKKSLRIGFRTLELVEENLGNGNSFYFRVNGKPIFMKGSNYIPSHILPELSQNHERIRHLLQSAKDAHMNMIRIWGGGIYESDYFYDLADTLGILIWQDMMFACAMYPVDEDFLKSVRLETIQNAKRIGYHPSVAIFAANNENEVALVQNWYGTSREFDRFSTEYRQLYVANVLHELKILESSARPRPLVSSPSNGIASIQNNYISENPQDPNYGDVHFYITLEDGWNANVYPRPRFASEYGFQSLPMMHSWQRSMKSRKDDLLELIEYRQHHPLGMGPITALIKHHLPLPKKDDERYAEALIYFSQIAQAMATKVETEFYRSLRDTEHHTMGALYWQLNDVWVAPSWSSIDYYGNYKVLHYWAKEFLAPVAIIVLHDEKLKTLNVSLVCDDLKPATDGLTVTRNIYLWSRLHPKSSITWPVTLVPNGVQYDKVISMSEILSGEFNSNNCFLEFVLHRGTNVISRTYYFPDSIERAVGIGDPDLQLKIAHYNCFTSGVVMHAYSLTIAVKRPAVFVYIELIHPNISKYKLSHNGFMQMVPVKTVHLEFEHNECITLLSSHLKVLTVNEFML